MGGITLNNLLLVDGNSILNRAFYGIMGNKMLQTEDGTYTNAVYGFLAIMFKLFEDVNPEYLAGLNYIESIEEYKKLIEGLKNNEYYVTGDEEVDLKFLALYEEFLKKDYQKYRKTRF